MLKNDRSMVELDIVQAINNAELPYESIGWPPNIEEYVRKVALNVARAIVDSIYTQQELDKEVEHILLQEP